MKPTPLLAAILLVLPSALRGQGLDPQAAAGTITAQDLHHRIGVLAHDSMRGRDTPSPELDEVAGWIASEFRRMGLQPAGDDDTYLQRYPIRALAVDADASSLSSSTGATTRFGEGVVPLRFSSLRPADAEGPVVLVTGTPDAGDPSALAMTGRHVVYVGPERAAFPLLREAGRQGAASVLMATALDDARWGAVRGQASGRRGTVVGDGDAGLLVLQVRDRVLDDLLGMDVGVLRARGSQALRGRELPGISLKVVQRVDTLSEAWAPNVVAVLPGSDPALRDEYVVFSAHMDHVGVGAPDATGDSIYNGADDDASGTATVMEVAEALASLERSPRRSMLFLLVSGEEKGLWGSGWFAEHPTVPVDAMVANLNADMVGRNWSDTIVAIGREHSDLGRTLARVNAAHPEIGMTAIGDLWPEENFYRRSDHFNFARKGVPVLFFFNGTHADYHEPSDELEAIDTEKTARIGKLLFWLGLEVGDAAERPSWNPSSYRAIVEGAGG